MQVDDKLINYLEDISCLALSDGEKSCLKGELQEVLDSMEPLRNFSAGDVSECSHPIDNVNVFRDDEVRPSFDRELIIGSAPVRNDEMIIAPKLVE